MKTREDILNHISSTLVELFEVPAEKINEAAKLYEDLDIDSIDAIDLIIELKGFTGKKITPEDFKNVRSIGDIIDAVEELLRDE